MSSNRLSLEQRFGPWIGPALFLIFLLVYTVTLTRGPHPGESAVLLAQRTGLDPFGSPLYPLWGALLSWVVALSPTGYATVAGNFLSAVCASLAVWAMYVLVARLPLWPSDDRHHISSRLVRRLSYLSGTASALFLGFSAPFWMAATQAHHLPFELLFFLCVALLFVEFWRTDTMRWLYAFSLLYGVGVVESVVFVLCAPLFGFFLLFRLALRGQLRVGLSARLLGLLLVGLLFYLVAAWRFYETPAYVWREYEHFFQIIWYMWRDQWYLMTRGVSQIGWLMVLMTAVFPCVFVLFTPRRVESMDAHRPGPLLLHLVFTGLAVLLLINAPVAPWPLMGRSNLVVFPYLLWALYAGYLVGYWFMMLSGALRRSSLPISRIQHVAQLCWIPLVAAGLIYSIYLNARETSRKDVHLLNDFLEEVVDALGSRTWIVSNGVVDHSLMLMARDRGKELTVLNPRMARNPAYLRHVASLFDDPRMKSLAEISLIPLLNEWITSDDAIGQKLVVLAWDDLWSTHQRYAIPEGIFYGGAASLDDVDVATLYAAHQSLWEQWTDRLAQAPRNATHAAWIRSHLSRMANNFGVFLEESDATDRAFSAYQASRAFEPDNVSALLNMVSLAHRDERPETEALNEDLKALEERPAAQLQHWTLAARYGYITHPEAFARRGMAWAMSGKPQVGIAEVQRAMRGAQGATNLNLLLASMYFFDEQLDASEAVYTRVLERDPEQAPALLGMARLSTRRGQFDLSQGYLDRVRELNAMPDAVRYEQAVLDVMSGNEAAGRERLEALVKDRPESTDAWTLLTLVALAQEDEELLDRAMRVLTQRSNMDARSLMMVAHAHVSRGRLADARAILDRVIRVQPSHLGALEWLLRLDVVERRQDDARNRVERMLAIDSRQPFANYVLGSLQYADGQVERAETSFRIAIAERPTPEAYNDLAWVLQERGAYEEARTHAQTSLELNARNPNAWHTYGIILNELKDLDGAVNAFEEAHNRSPNDPRIVLSLALTHEARNDQQQTQRWTDLLADMIETLPENDQARAQSLIQRQRE